MSKIVLERIREYLEVQKLDAFFCTKLVNVRYISGYTSDDAFLFITRDKQFFITDPRYTELAGAQCPDYTLVEWRKQYGTVAAACASLAKATGAKKIGFESLDMNVNMFRGIEDGLTGTNAELAPMDGVIEDLRMHKTPQEIEYARAACEITVRAYDRIQKDIRPGITEKELAANLSRYMVLEGADTMPYGNILISGARTSLLHGIPSSKSVEYGDFVLMDYGCQFHGYMSDMTRTLVVGKATPKQREVYRLVKQMSADTEAYLRDGAISDEAYRESVKAIENTEYLPYHYTGIGHGVGLFVHEEPFLGPGRTRTIEKNTILTVEPGLYIPGWGGVRIEDTVLVLKEGVENLTPATKELIEL